ncbi:condensation domain-containing protein [Tsukamurella strandjordii]|nr:hypothetical protein TTY48_40060 [Tsukamurella sp. TY48]
MTSRFDPGDAPAVGYSGAVRLLPEQMNFVRGRNDAPGTSLMTIGTSSLLPAGADLAVFTEALHRTTDECRSLGLRILSEGANLQVDYGPLPFRGHLTFASEGEFLTWGNERFRKPYLLDGTALGEQWTVEVDGRVGYAMFGDHAVLDGYAAALFRNRLAKVYVALLAGREPEHFEFVEVDELLANREPFPVDLEMWSSLLSTEGWANPQLSLTSATAAMAPDPVTFRHDLHITPSGRQWPHHLLGLVGAYCARYTGNRRSIIGSVMVNRLNQRERAAAVTMTNVVPIRLDVSETATGAELANQVSAGITRAGRGRVDTRELFQSMPGAIRAGRLYGPTVNVIPFLRPDPENEKWNTRVHGYGPVSDVSVVITQTGAGDLILFTEFNPQLYSPVRARTHADRLARWLDATAGAPDRPLSEISALTPAEAQAHRALAGTPGVTLELAPNADAAEPVWGAPTDAVELARAGGQNGVYGMTVTTDLGDPALFGSAGWVTLLTEHGAVPTDYRVELTESGCVYRGTGAERVRVHGGFVELGEIRHILRGDHVDDVRITVGPPVRAVVTVSADAPDDLPDVLRAACPNEVRLRFTGPGAKATS